MIQKIIKKIQVEVHRLEKYRTTQQRSAGPCAKKYMLKKVELSVLNYLSCGKYKHNCQGSTRAENS